MYGVVFKPTDVLLALGYDRTSFVLFFGELLACRCWGVRVVAVEKSNFRVLFLPFWSASSPSLFREVGFFAFKFACGLLEKLSPVARFVIVVKVALRLFAAS